MIFDDDFKVIPSTMNGDDKIQFIQFLKEEKLRHLHDIEICELRIKGAKYLGQLSKAEFYYSAIKRHKLDLEDMDKLIKELR